MKTTDMIIKTVEISTLSYVGSIPNSK